MRLAVHGVLAMLALLGGCWPTEQEKAQFAEEKRIHCMDNSCPGDVVPKHNLFKETALKLNGQWFIGPSEYFSSGIGGAAFYWPSKTPVRSSAADFSEKALANSKRADEVTIHIFLRSNHFPPEPRGYKFIELAIANEWIAERRILRPGLEAIQMRHVTGPTGHYIDHVTYYVATDLKGIDGLPPVATCAHRYGDDIGGAGFMWQPGIWVGTRMNQKHCADWPEIFQEITRVLQLIKKA